MKLNQVIASFLREIAKAQASSDAYAQELKESYKGDSFLRLLPVPRAAIEEIKLDLKYAILESERSNWVIGSRDNQRVVAIDINSEDSGQTLTGTMKYIKEGAIGFRATYSGGNNYIVENQWGGSNAPWHEGGTWVIGDRTSQRVVALNLTSQDEGKSLNGTVTYNGEGSIDLTCVRAEGDTKSEQQQNVYIASYIDKTDNRSEVEVEVITDNLNNFPESMLSSISITLDIDSA